MIAVLFEASVSPEGQARYLELAAELRPLLDGIDGFVSIERFQSITQPGELLSLSYWQDETAVIAWRRNPEHRAAQAEGQAGIFSTYRIRVASVFRDYGH
jgi:heme-degrading monooxygenase HmoA